ncbi:hypothetical protein D3P08_03785 [Paenibacillus nanensis]|uniref:PIN like domain-containing protein n=1 Tax=Paenibacillus nanensis TaxID=393251 RepID=A0A3A1VI41_9BACL|nr:PIN-like domain-containing protein [Paenibacillus nanensis]RIX59286.1 hypothetical protein D3P08_03785 [Paenibacillus nanensis]
MATKFFSYTGYDSHLKKEILSNANISFDANTLLNAYKMTPDARNQFINVLKRFKERLWMPYQVGKEFYDNRSNVIKTEMKSLAEVKLT